MKQEYKDLLLQDLCARLPYGVKCKFYDCCEGDYNEGEICGFERQEYMQIDGVCIHIEEVKPYLFPISSMKGMQKAELYNSRMLIEEPFQDTLCEIDFYHRNHFDYRGLIEKGLAIDATGLNIYKKE